MTNNSTGYVNFIKDTINTLIFKGNHITNVNRAKQGYGESKGREETQAADLYSYRIGDRFSVPN